MLVKLEQSTSRALAFVASGRLTDNDYKNFLIPEVKAALEANERLALMFVLENFHGWEIRAAWDDLIFSMEITSFVERMALVGDRDWERWMARLVRVFTAGEVRYFELAQRDAAWQWLKGDA